MSKWTKLIDTSFAYGSIMNDDFINRMKTCYNACLNLENPEQDLLKIIEALKDTNQTLRFSSYANGIIFKRSIELSDKALALVKE